MTDIQLDALPMEDVFGFKQITNNSIATDIRKIKVATVNKRH
ncbi:MULTISPECIES: hypothetical protein [Vibrio]|nr:MULTISPECIES: hypothetical protein [Vibrio]EEX32235.1 hypothetical protein VIC_003334 [Vibrio coralliilyticus ATCC BAA-450]